MRVTIKDIAQALNLSKTTVSFVLSGIGSEKGVSKLTQERILEYVRKINYQPNQLAQSLISGVTHTIGVVVPSIGDAFYAKLVKEIELEAEKKGYVIIISSSERLTEREANLIRVMRAKQVDGLIIAPTEDSEKEMEELLKANFPFVLIDRFFPGLKTNYVVVDDVETSSRMVRNLIEKGRRRIALITTNTKVSAITDRLKGYEKALAEAGIPFDPALYVEVPRNDYARHIGPILQELFAKHPEIDGLFFTAHYLASETMLFMHKNGMRIGGYGLAAIHENAITSVLSPNMSVARIPIESIGRSAVGILIENMKNKENAPATEKVLKTDISIND